MNKTKKAVKPSAVKKTTVKNTPKTLSAEERSKTSPSECAVKVHERLSNAYLLGGVTKLRKELRLQRTAMLSLISEVESAPPTNTKADKYHFAWLLSSLYAGLGVCEGYSRLLE